MPTYSTLSDFTLKRGLGSLLKVLSKLNALEELEAGLGKLWDEGDFIGSLTRLENWENDPGLVAEAKTTLQDLRNVGVVLSNLQGSLVQVTEALENTLLPFEFGRGLSSLPNDILSNIFEFLVEESKCSGCWSIRRKKWPQLPHLRLSLVNRRFRDTVSNSPRLWASPCNQFDPSTMKTFLAKSKAAGLNLSLRLVSPPFPGLMPLMLPHCARWEDLTLNLEESYAWEKEVACKFFKYLELPRLHSLTVVYPLDEEDVEDLDFYKTWDFRNLRSLEIHYKIPKSFTVPLLTKFTLRFVAGTIYVQELLEFLSVNPSLEDITFVALFCDCDGLNAHDTVTLENVKTLTIESNFSYCITKFLRTPHLREIKVEHLDELYDTDDYHTIEHALCHESYPHLETIRFDTYHRNVKYKLPLHKTPNLRSLLLDTPDSSPCDIGPCTLPPLREIHICSSLDGEWVPWMAKLHRNMVEQDRLSGLESLVIRLHSELIKEYPNFYIAHCIAEITELFGTSRVIWTGVHEPSKNSELQIKFSGIPR